MIKILPILDRRCIVPHAGVISFSDSVSKKEITDTLARDFGILNGDLIVVPITNTDEVYICYVNVLSKKIHADLVPPKDLPREFFSDDQISYVTDFVTYDLSQITFTYREDLLENISTPQTFTFCNIKNTDLFCIVRDGGESHFSLPGGTCELWETGEEGAIRETKEEAQLDISNLILLGVNHVKIVYPNRQYVHEFFQPRYLAYVEKSQIQDFIPFGNGFEVEERRFVPLSELPQYIKWLNAENGVPYIEKLSSLILGK